MPAVLLLSLRTSDGPTEDSLSLGFQGAQLLVGTQKKEQLEEQSFPILWYRLSV